MGQLKRIKIEGFKSIRSAELELRPINVLIGANGSGKSNLVSFFRMLNQLVEKRLQLFVQSLGGPQSVLYLGPSHCTEVSCELEFHTESFALMYEMRLAYAQPDSLVFSNEHFHLGLPGHAVAVTAEESHPGGHRESVLSRNRDDLETQLFDLLARCRAYHFHDTSRTARSRRSCYVHDNIALSAEAENLAAMLYLFQKTSPIAFERISSAVHSVVPTFREFVLNPDRENPNNILLNWRGADPDYLLGPHQLSDGTLRAIALCTLFLQPEDDLPDVIVIDEPELGLHPHALSLLAGMVQSVSSRTQVILATQSSELVGFFEPEDVVVVDSKNDETTFHRLDRAELSGWLEEYSLGELWSKNVVRAGPLS